MRRLSVRTTGVTFRLVPVLASLVTGLAAGSSLFVATLWFADHPGAFSGETMAGFAAALQAAGVFLGSFVVARLLGGVPAGRLVAAGLLLASALCLLLAAIAPGPLALVCLMVVGAAVGLGVAGVDSMAAATSPDRPTSAVLKIGLAGAIGAMLAPLLVHLAGVIGGAPFLTPAIAFSTAGGLWMLVPSRADAPDRDRTPQRWGLYVLPALLFGVVDNGVLALAPAQAAIDGANSWTVTWFGLAAAAGATLVQLGAIWKAERSPGAAETPDRLLAAGLLALISALVVLALRPTPLIAGGLLTLVGLLADCIYGLGLFAYLRRVAPGQVAGATAAYVCACALGETVGPLVLPWLGQWTGKAAPLVAAVLAVICMAAARRPVATRLDNPEAAA